MRINNNMMAVTAINNLAIHQNKVAKSVMRLSTGKRINSAADDPAGMAIAQKLKMRIRYLEVVQRAAGSVQDAIDCYDGELQGRQDILQRMREISVQTSGDTLSFSDKGTAMKEFEELLKEFSDSTFKETGLQIVAMKLEGNPEALYYMKDNRIFVGEEWVELNTLIPEASREESSPMSLTDYYMKQVSSQRSTLGAASSRIERQLSRLSTEEMNALEALSRIEDVDFAKETIELFKERMLTQVATLIAAQANAQPEKVLQLLEPRQAVMPQAM